MDGIIIVYKEKGFTSHDVVAKLRGILKMKKIGHTGTLDPDAEGVLPVCLGKATKLCDLLTDKDKTYQAVMKLGIVTDTQDMSGTVLEEKSVECVREQIEEAILSFVGDYDQIPPMYSALKVNGKKLYELAREGKEVERKARRVHIHGITIQNVDMDAHEVTMEVSCSKGTYIRTLCADIGEKLQCGACMKSLLRTKVERFTLEDSLRLSEIEEKMAAGVVEDVIVPVDVMFSHYIAVTVKENTSKLLTNGNPFRVSGVQEQIAPQDKELFRVYKTDGTFAALYEYRREQRMLYPYKMF